MKTKLTILGSLLAVALTATAWLVFAPVVEETVEDRPGDLALEGSARRPETKGIADIRFAQVYREDGRLIFDTTVSLALPESINGGYFDLRWDVDGRTDWVVVATFTSGVEAAVIRRETGLGRSTVSGDFPGEIEVEGDLVRIALDADALADFPSRFRWKLTSRLNYQQSNPGIAEVYDYAPEGRFANYRL